MYDVYLISKNGIEVLIRRFIRLKDAEELKQSCSITFTRREDIRTGTNTLAVSMDGIFLGEGDVKEVYEEFSEYDLLIWEQS